MNNSSPQLKPAFNWIAQSLIVLLAGANLNPFLSLELLRQPQGSKEFIEFMRAADLGIDRIEVREEDLPAQNVPAAGPSLTLQISLPQPTPGSPPPSQKVFMVFTWHKRNETAESVAFDLSDESDGTRKLFEFTGGWLRALNTGATLFVDELDRSLHPHITRFLVALFHGARNTKNAQLVFTTHDTTLLDASLLRRDQIWFVEKDAQQSTKLYPLLDYQQGHSGVVLRRTIGARYLSRRSESGANRCCKLSDRTRT